MKQILLNGGSVWGFGEYIGVLKYIQDYNISFDRIYGISAGTGIGICILFNIPWEELFKFYNDIICETNYDDSLTINHMKGLEFVFKNAPDDAYKQICGKLYIRLSGENGGYWKSQFSSNRDLMNAMVCGGSIPFISTYECVVQGNHSYDGGVCPFLKIEPEYLPITPFPLSVIPPHSVILNLLLVIGEKRIAHILEESIDCQCTEEICDGSSYQTNTNICIHSIMKIYNIINPPSYHKITYQYNRLGLLIVERILRQQYTFDMST